MNGLKDHQIQELINSVRNELKPFIKLESLREFISGAVMEYLEKNKLRIDKPKNEPIVNRTWHKKNKKYKFTDEDFESCTALSHLGKDDMGL